MRPSSSKAKGRRLQNKVAELLRTKFSSLDPDDIKPAIMGESGVDIKLSPAAKKLIPWAFECKNVERLNVWEALAQAESNAGKESPALVFTKNRKPIYVALNFELFLELLRETKPQL